MSDISEYLQAIQNATYGEQVRSAIYNAISTCYDDVTSGVTVANTAAAAATSAASTASNAATAADSARASLTSSINTAISSMKTQISSAVSSLTTRINSLAASVSDSLNDVETAVTSAYTAASSATSAANAAISAKNAASSAASAANTAAASAIAAYSSAVSAATNAVSIATSAAASLTTSVNSAISAMNAEASSTFASLSNQVSSAIQQMSNTVGTEIISLTTLKTQTESARDSAIAASSAATNAASSAMQAYSSAMAAWSSATAAASSARDAASSAYDAVVDCTSARTAATTAANLANSAATTANNAANAISAMSATASTIDPGMQAAVSVTKEATGFTFNFSIPRGSIGPANIIKGHAYATVEALEADISDPAIGDQYNVGVAPPYNVYRWTGTQWEDQGGIGIVFSNLTNEQIDILWDDEEAISSPTNIYINHEGLYYLLVDKIKDSLDSKVDSVTGKSLSTNDFTDAYRSQIDTNTAAISTLDSLKVDKVTGQGLSTNNFSNAYKTKLDGINASNDTPLMDGTAAVGSSGDYARGDHVHPRDTGLCLRKTGVTLGTGNNAELARITDSRIKTSTVVTSCSIASLYGLRSDLTWTSHSGYVAFTGTNDTATTIDVVLLLSYTSLT